MNLSANYVRPFCDNSEEKSRREYNLGREDFNVHTE